MSPDGSMRAAVWPGGGAPTVSSVAAPSARAGWTLLRPERVGICGTDHAIVAGVHPRARAGLILGHEVVGRALDGPYAGRQVVVEPLISCGSCAACLAGHTHVCSRLGLYGIDAPGGMAELLSVPDATLIEVGEQVPLDQAALIEPLAVAVHAVRESGIGQGQRVVVIGGGPIGVLTALVAREAGASVLMAEPAPFRAATAEAVGFTVVRDPDVLLDDVLTWTQGTGADVVVDAVARPVVATALAALARVRGLILLVGVYEHPAHLDLRQVVFSELRVLGTRVYTRADMDRAVELVESRALPLAELPVTVHPLSRVADAFTNTGAALKVLVEPGR